MQINNDVKNAKTMSISWRYKNDRFIMRHKRKAETFFRKIEFSADVQFFFL